MHSLKVYFLTVIIFFSSCSSLMVRSGTETMVTSTAEQQTTVSASSGSEFPQEVIAYYLPERSISGFPGYAGKDSRAARTQPFSPATVVAEALPALPLPALPETPRQKPVTVQSNKDDKSKKLAATGKKQTFVTNQSRDKEDNKATTSAKTGMNVTPAE
jgi:hypothetical protein